MIAYLPLISILAMIWLWRDTGDTANISAHAEATFWFVLPSLPMFLLVPAMLRSGFGFWTAMLTGCAITVAFFGILVWVGPRIGLRL